MSLKVEELEAEIKKLNDTLGAFQKKFEDGGKKDANLEGQMTKIAEDMADLTSKMEGLTKEKKEKEAAEKAAEEIDRKKYEVLESLGMSKKTAMNMNFVKFLNLASNNPNALKQYIKTFYEQSEKAAEGGYTVPEEFSKQIIDLQIQYANLASLCPPAIKMATNKINLNSVIANPSVSWIAEKGRFATTKITFGRPDLTLGKLGCLVPFTNELLDDTQVDMTAFLINKLGKVFAKEIDNTILNGVDGTNPFDGILVDTNIGSRTIAGATIDWTDLVLLMSDISSIYNPVWVMNKKGLAKVMLMKDDNRRPIWTSPVDGEPGKIFGMPYKIDDNVSGLGTTASTTTIALADFDYLLLGDPMKKPGLTIDVSKDAVVTNTDTDTSVEMSAFEQDYTVYRFKQRKAALIADTSAFKKLTDVK